MKLKTQEKIALLATLVLFGIVQSSIFVSVNPQTQTAALTGASSGLVYSSTSVTSSPVNIGSDPTLDNLGPLTYAVKINPSSVGSGIFGGGEMFDKQRKAFYLSNIASPGKPIVLGFFSSNSTINTNVYCNTAIPANAWTHVAVVSDGSVPFNGTFYINGVACAPSGTLGSGSPVLDASADQYIGSRYDGSSVFPGQLDDARIYNRVLSSAEIQELANGTSQQAPVTPVVSTPTCSYADVTALVAAAPEGGTLTIPSGTCTWNSTLEITKSLTIQGSGTNLLYGGVPLIRISLPSDKPVRITGFAFGAANSNTVDGWGIDVEGNTTGSFGLSKIRIDHNTFTNGTRQIFWKGWATGVVDHNTFTNGNIAIGFFGDDAYSWNRPIVPGGSDAVFIEDNTFIINDSVDREPNHAIYHQNGARSVTRHNTFNASAYTKGNAIWFDSHGNWNGGGAPVSPDSAAALNFHAQPLLEVYENTFTQDHSFEWGNLRGGTTYFWNNSLTQTGPGKPVFKITEEESWQTAFFLPLRTTWPAREQIKNTYFWNNTINGSPLTLTLSKSEDAVFLQENRDYFMHAPSGYTPYPYPHYLTTGQSAPIIAPPPQTSATTNTYWVSVDGQSIWTNCKSDTPLAGNLACPLATAAMNANAGDTVNLRGGIYTISGNYVSALAPKNSGTASQIITFKAYSGESPILAKGSGTDITGLFIDGNSYLKIDGLTFKNFSRWGTIRNSAHHNEVLNSTFTSDTGEEGFQGFWMNATCRGGSLFNCPVTNNWIHHNTFSKLHGFPSNQACYEGADLVRIGLSYGASNSPNDNNNTVENNTLEYAGHTLFDNYGMYTVFRNNIMHNEPWISDFSNGSCIFKPVNGKYGHRNFQITEDYGRDGTYVLVEGNRAGFASANPNNPGATNFELAAPKNIVRYNYFFGAMRFGLYFKYSTNGRLGAGGMGSTNNRVYNNTLFHNGFGYTWPTNVDDRNGIKVVPGTLQNVLKNNIVYDSGETDIEDTANVAEKAGNWVTTNGDPKFTNPNISNPQSTTLPDLSLRGGSGAIDSGVPLTQTAGSGSSSRTLVVKDALYFQDGTWGSDLSRGGFFADWILVGSTPVQIQSINYSTNTITLASPISWTTNTNIWLYKDSAGKQVFYGTAPDVGAFEYVSGIVQPVSTSVLGDFNKDGLVNSLDLSLLSGAWNQNNALYDLNKDGMVNTLDFTLMVKNWTL